MILLSEYVILLCAKPIQGVFFMNKQNQFLKIGAESI
jgi:hypothetical protein